MKSGVAIQQMKIRGDTRQKSEFLTSLDYQSWPDEDFGKIIFINKIHVSGQWWELANKIAQEANQWKNNEFSSETRIEFSNYTEMASEFIRHLLSGNQPWFLKSWLKQQELTAEPIAILIHQIKDIPSILDKLNHHKLLDRLFSYFSIQDLQKLQIALSSLGASLTSLSGLFNPDGTLDKVIKLNFPESAKFWIKEYLEFMIKPQASKKEIDIVLSIISCLSIWRFAPQWLNDVNGFQIWHSQVNELYRENSHPTLTLTLPLARGGNKSLLLEKVRSEQDKTNLTLTLPFVRGADSPSPLPRGRLGGGEDLPVFIIHQTGLLFLINLLKTNPTLTLPFVRGGDKFLPLVEGEARRGCKEFEEKQNPWITLHQIFKKIAEEFSFSIESSLKNLLVEVSAVDVDEFCQQSERDNFLAEELFEQIKQKLQRMNLWNSDWFFIPARFEIDQAYVHGYLDNSTVCLDIRRAGLDINPGWVPWLGRVINFHYGSYPELQLQVGCI
jgi:hypothetical protein